MPPLGRSVLFLTGMLAARDMQAQHPASPQPALEPPAVERPVLEPQMLAKPVLDTSTLRRWPQVRDATISHDGAYALYVVEDPRRSAGDAQNTLMIRARQTAWQTALPGVERGVFTADSRRVVFRTTTDSLGLLTLGSAAVEYIPHVRAFELTIRGPTEWLVYQRTAPARELVLRNLATGRHHRFADVTTYELSEDGRTLVLQTVSAPGGTAPAASAPPARHAVRWVTLADGTAERTSRTVWTGSRAPTDLVLDAAGTQGAFVVEDTAGGRAARTLWYYRAGTPQAVPVPVGRSAGLEPGLRLGRVARFSQDGQRLFVWLEELERPAPGPEAVSVDVWSYHDPALQTEQRVQPRRYLAMLALADRRLVRLQREHEEVSWLDEERDAVAWVEKKGSDAYFDDDEHWNIAAQRTFYLVSTTTGARRRITPGLRFPELSPNGRYVVGLDLAWRDVYGVEVATGTSRNLTAALPIPESLGDMLSREYADRPSYEQSRGLGFAGWVGNGDEVLLYDEFDLWRLDLAGQRAPVNLTNGYGRQHRIAFRLAGSYSTGREAKVVPPTGTLLLNAFDRTTKQTGFYRITLGKSREPVRLTMGPYIYDGTDQHYLGGWTAPLKARDAEVYLVSRQSAGASPNYFWTTDFKTFTPASAVYPERRYNWLTAELVTFPTLDGRTEQAVLYKPENFDSTKKYPVILHYYERKSQHLYRYFRPAEPNGDLDIAWFVSHGYVVFTPDIHYATGEIGQGAYNSVVGAAQYLTQFPWVDASKLGLQGHSFGGYETNYLVTHTNLFAAAVSSSGLSNLVSGYNGFFGGGGKSAQGYYERHQLRLAATLWERPDLYIKNSPIFQLHQVTTPLLTVANQRDNNVPFHHGLELFLGLRRLGRRVWMLQYDEGGHGLGGKEYVDYVIRMTQFFDHYLKGAPPAKWMTRGIPARMKGLDDGMALDHEIPTPGPGLLIEPSVTSAPTSSVTTSSSTTPPAGHMPVVP